ncbi:SDR family NAD(P)-dependent oxidoreductase [Usitatibacter palustris]|uniref:4-formylbenzenesulfonate dehydrogenase TsaC1/TsaC2 n=1 Tax=Usitatibacter palustris TaxID=2732487 RepID=A0A6M4H483_9PROT|nr:SDR family oxidoreductase [Usitatibacter palustris]QJR14326.1 4-formylbenzenesulfonate dehydrogenase TsaC1/TsaC2 [Usitatibacter palustris]
MDTDNLFDLKGKAAFIPGGYGGIGEAVARGLAAAGATVTVAGRDGSKADALGKELTAAGQRAFGVAMDANKVASIREATDKAAQHMGRLDILVNCIGMNREQKIADVTEEQFDEIYRVNLRSAMFLAQQAAKYQVEGKRGGKQVQMLSVRSMLGMRGYGYSAYCSTKGALVMLVKQHALELAANNIQVNGVAPTVVETAMAGNWKKDPGRWEALLARIPLGRVAQPRDIVGATLFFCAPASDFVTGQVLYLDGGITATQ